MKILPVLGSHDGVQDYWRGVAACPDVVVDHEKPDYVVVLGGDGTFLGAERMYYKMGVPFVGVGFGRVNFLLNRSAGSPQAFVQALQQPEAWRRFPFHGIAATVTTDRGEQKGVGFNDVYIKALHPTHIVRLTVETNEHAHLDVAGDGIIVATPQGSTAYNRNAGGTTLPLSSALWCVTGICTQQQLHEVIAHQTMTITIHSDDVVVVTDHDMIVGARHVVLAPSKYQGTILLGVNENFEQRRYAA